ncbi:unnamed protein product, partial [Pylaiella littoralis]
LVNPPQFSSAGSRFSPLLCHNTSPRSDAANLATQQRSEAETSRRRATDSRVPRLIILGDKGETEQVTPRTAPV